MLSLDCTNIFQAVGQDELESYSGKLAAAHEKLAGGTGEGSEFTGWLEQPERYGKSSELRRVLAAAERIRSTGDALVVIGIGGSYLGARAAIELLRDGDSGTPEVYFAGTGFSPDDLGDIIDRLEGRDFSVNVISKSGTTLEPAITFRIFKDILVSKYGREAAKRIYATTDSHSGALREMAAQEGYETFTVPADIGGRYSVISSVGLLPMAVAGIDVAAFLSGAQAAMRAYERRDMSNPAWQYAAARSLLYEKGKKIEILAYYEPSFRVMSEWWKQLYGESEGKNGKGIFPASVQLTADLHSLGQYIQEGERSLFETAVFFRGSRRSFSIPGDEKDLDGLNYLAGRDLGDIQRQAALAALLAHADGGVPNMLLELDKVCAETLGELIYFFMISCALSGYVQGLNPFDQPGVEAYKRNIFAILGRPGFEELRAEILRRIE